MKPPAIIFGLVVILLLAFNLVESVRIRKALCGEYTVYHQSLRIPDLGSGNSVRSMWEQQGMERQGWKCIGYHQEEGSLYVDFVRVSREDKLMTHEEADEMVKIQTSSH